LHGLGDVNMYTTPMSVVNEKHLRHVKSTI